MRLGIWLIVVANSLLLASSASSTFNAMNHVLGHRKNVPLRPLDVTGDSSEDEEKNALHEHDSDEELELLPVAVRGGATESTALADLMDRLKIGFYFALWYALNIVYNSKLQNSVFSLKVLVLSYF